MFLYTCLLIKTSHEVLNGIAELTGFNVFQHLPVHRRLLNWRFMVFRVDLKKKMEGKDGSSDLFLNPSKVENLKLFN